MMAQALLDWLEARSSLRALQSLSMFQGIIPPVVTPFTRSGDLDLEALRATIKWLEPRVNGFLILGSNGEVPYLTEPERNQVLEAARAVIPSGVPMIAGTGGESTAQVIERCRVAAGIGADAVLVIAPFYNRASMTPPVLETHFRAVADASPIPVFVYNIPQVSGITHAPAWFAKVATHPNIRGLKDSSGDIMNLTEIARVVPEGFNVLTGNAPTLLPALSVGAQGAILAAANVIPEVFSALRNAFLSKELERALALQRRSNALSYAVTRDYGVPGLKAAMRARGVPGGYPRAPLLDVDETATKNLETLLRGLEDVLKN
jgi:4-hydroxy-2-oxoglutarate aldolase